MRKGGDELPEEQAGGVRHLRTEMGVNQKGGQCHPTEADDRSDDRERHTETEHDLRVGTGTLEEGRRLAGLLLHDIRLDSSVAGLPCSEIDVELSMRLRFVRSRRNAHFKDVSTSLFGHAVGPLQCVLQVSEKIGVADEDVQAADAPPGLPQAGPHLLL